MKQKNNDVCAIYCRVSAEDGNEQSTSIVNQRINLVEFAKEKNFEIFCIYVDDGSSGKDFNRPAFQKMLVDLKSKKFSLILVKDISRIGRNLVQVGEFIEETCPLNNVRVISLLDEYDSAIKTNEGSIVLKSFINDYYLKECRRKSLDFYEKTISKEIFNRGHVYGYEYKNGSYSIVVNEAIVIKHIFEQLANGVTPKEISNKLNCKNIPTPGYSLLFKRGRRIPNYSKSIGLWTTTKVINLAKKTMYYGSYSNATRSKYFNTSIIRNSNPLIVEKELYDKANEFLRKHKKRNTKKRSDIAGLFEFSDGSKFVKNTYKQKLRTKGLILEERIKVKNSLGKVITFNLAFIKTILKEELNSMKIELRNNQYILNGLTSDDQIQLLTKKIRKTEYEIKNKMEKNLTRLILKKEYKKEMMELRTLLLVYERELDFLKGNDLKQRKNDELISKVFSLNFEEDVLLIARKVFKKIIIAVGRKNEIKMSFEYSFE